MKTRSWVDPIVAETRKWREELLEDAGNDLGVLTQRLIESQTRHGNNLVFTESSAVNQDRSDSTQRQHRDDCKG